MGNYEDSKTLGVSLWIAQGLLALIFLFAGGMKLVVPVDVLTEQMPVPLPAIIVRLIGSCEFLGAIGVVLPGILRIRTRLTPVAAAGLLLIMAGAAGFTLGTGEVAGALIPAVVGLLAAFVAYGRARLSPHRVWSRALVLQAAS